VLAIVLTDPTAGARAISVEVTTDHLVLHRLATPADPGTAEDRSPATGWVLRRSHPPARAKPGR
jgi:hypothetical protein